MVAKGFPVRDPFRVNDFPGFSTIKQFDELLIHRTRLWMREPAVFVKDRGMTPLLELAKAPDQAARTMLTLVTVDQNGVVTTIEKDSKRGTDLVVRD